MTEKDLLNQVITLKDGRKLGYAEFGIENGKPVFYFHGHGSSRLEPKIYNIEIKVRLPFPQKSSRSRKNLYSRRKRISCAFGRYKR